MSLRIVIVGYGRMGKAVDRLCDSYGCEVVERLDIHNNVDGAGLDAERLPAADVVIDFSTADALLTNLPRVAAIGLHAVIGTTGWNAHEERMRAITEAAGIGVVAAANFSLGVNVFQVVAERAAQLMQPLDEFGAWIHETHHAAKIDAPSGTAIALRDGMRRAGYAANIDMASTRAGACPGTHAVGFDGPFESLSLTHATRDRATFAHGAIAAARWVHGRRGWFSMRDVLGLER
jgi:4-hydroxy-tetrahydrodipicolinate reductase